MARPGEQGAQGPATAADPGAGAIWGERLLATAVWALTVVVVVSGAVVLDRLITSTSGYFAAIAVLLGLSAPYARWLARRLHRDEQPRWRLGRDEAAVLLPATLGVAWLAAGVASSTYWPDWLGSAVGGAGVAAVTRWALQRGSRSTPSPVTAADTARLGSDRAAGG